MRDLLHSALCALLIAGACGGGDPPGGGNGDTDGGDTTDGGGNPGDDGPTGDCQWDEDAFGYPYPDDPDDPMMDPDCNLLIPIINENADNDDRNRHGWRDVRRDDGMPLRTDFTVMAAVNDPACFYAYRGDEEPEIRHAPGDACVSIRNETIGSLVLAGDRLSIDVTSEIQDQRFVVVAEGQVLDNGTRMRYTILEGNNGPINWTFEIERLPPPSP